MLHFQTAQPSCTINLTNLIIIRKSKHCEQNNILVIMPFLDIVKYCFTRDKISWFNLCYEV